MTESIKSSNNGNLNLKDIINELIEILSSKSNFDNYFKADIEIFAKIKENFDNGIIRVGLIGITSSGKSTLINAFLGEQLLPQKVKPSSNILVVCCYEKIKKATIFFEEVSKKAPEVIFTNISKSIEKYGDEHYNPGNTYQVKEIRVGTPTFKLSKSIALVDSPGLDAYEMELHDKITLQLALPTLDLVLYLTTVKASSDKENLFRIDEISTDGKPLIVVQNMIDSIEPKIIKGGIVAKDKEEIREEHYLRLKKLLNNGCNSSTNNANIIQVSALQALNDKYEESNVEQLFNVITDVEIKLKISQENDRANQLSKKVDSLIGNLSNVVSYNFYKEEENVQYLNNDFKTAFKSDILDEKAVIEDFENYKRSKISEINSTNSETEIKGLIDLFLKEKEKNEIDLSNSIKKTQDDIITFGKKLNFTTQDLRIAINNSPSKSKIDIRTTLEHKTNKKTVSKEGISGSFGRFFGDIIGNKDWGYEIIEERVSYAVIDKKTLIFHMNTIFENWKKWYTDTFNKYKEQRIKGIEKINDGINLKRNSINDKKRNIILSDDKNELISKLKEIAFQLKRKISVSNHKFSIDKSEYNTSKEEDEECIIDQSKMVIDLFRLSHINSYYPLYAIRDFCLEKVNSRSIFIWGWDNNDLISFTNLFFQSPEPILNSNFSVKLNTDAGEISLINENNFKKDQHMFFFKKLSEIDSTIFVNVDLSQLGFLEKKYKESIINAIPKKTVIWVVQGLEILLKNDSLIEAVVNFSNYLDKINAMDRLFIVSSKDPYYSLLVHELINIDDLNNFLISDERAIINKVGKNREEEVSRYIKQYLFEKRN